MREATERAGFDILRAYAPLRAARYAMAIGDMARPRASLDEAAELLTDRSAQGHVARPPRRPSSCSRRVASTRPPPLLAQPARPRRPRAASPDGSACSSPLAGPPRRRAVRRTSSTPMIVEPAPVRLPRSRRSRPSSTDSRRRPARAVAADPALAGLWRPLGRRRATVRRRTASSSRPCSPPSPGGHDDAIDGLAAPRCGHGLADPAAYRAAALQLLAGPALAGDRSARTRRCRAPRAARALLARWPGWRRDEVDALLAGASRPRRSRTTPAPAQPARAGGRRPAGRGPQQRRAGPAALHQPEDGGGARLEHPDQARHVEPGRGGGVGGAPGPRAARPATGVSARLRPSEGDRPLALSVQQHEGPEPTCSRSSTDSSAAM